MPSTDKTEASKQLDSDFRSISVTAMEKVDEIYHKRVDSGQATTEEFRRAVMGWFGDDFFDFYSDWIEEGDPND